MGTNFYWYLDQELLYTAGVMDDNDSVPPLVKKVYTAAIQREVVANQGRNDYDRSDQYVIEDFRYYPGQISVSSLHIGKRSGGWTFGFHIYPSLGINLYSDWKVIFPYGQIKDEYGNPHTEYEFDKIIQEIGSSLWDKTKDRNNDMPYASLDPEYNLYRRNVGEYCAGHGDGPYDYILGDFS